MTITNLTELISALDSDSIDITAGVRQDGTSVNTQRINPIADNLSRAASLTAPTLSPITQVAPTSTAVTVIEAGQTVVLITGPKGDVGPQGPPGASGSIGVDGVSGVSGVGITGLSIDLSGDLIVTLTDATTVNAGTLNSAISIGTVTQGATAAASITGFAPNQILDLVMPNNLTGTPTAPTAISGTNTTQIATTEFVRTAVSDLINAAPEQLDTLSELANALADDSAFATTVTDLIATKAPIESPTFTGTVSGITATMVGLGNVTNESKATMFTNAALTGVPTATTAAGGTNTTQIATTAYVQTAGYNSQGIKTISTSAPSGGNDGDIWYQVSV
jgi:hypothetical protein